MIFQKKTKNHVIEELKSRSVVWHGKLPEQNFLNRFLDLKRFPSNDPRFETMEGDFWQHRINNPNDWDDDWIYNDERLALQSNDDLFSDFICELLHPSVRIPSKAKDLKDMINYYIKKDGYQIVEDEEFYEPGTSTYKINQINPTQIEKGFKTKDEFVHEAYEKIDKRLRDEDYGGAVTSARTLLEFTIKDIYYQITGDEIEKVDDLQDSYKKIQKLLRLHYDHTTDESKAKLLRSFVTIVNSLAPLYNIHGDRHATRSAAHRNTALFITDSTKIFVNFLYGRMITVHGIYPSIYIKLIDLLNSELRLKKREVIVANKEVAHLLTFCDGYLSNLLINKLIEDFEINNFRQSDIFCAFIRIFSVNVTESQLYKLLAKHVDNNQTAGFGSLVHELTQMNRDLLNARVRKVISEGRYYKFELNDTNTK